MPATRIQKIARVMKEELSRIIREEMNDPRLAMLSITEVKVTTDVRQAHVYVSVYGTKEEMEQTVAVLDGARKFLRGELARQVNMRTTPDLFFHLDKSIERGARVFELLKQVQPPPAPSEAGEGAAKADVDEGEGKTDE